jgi:hypothetical protein
MAPPALADDVHRVLAAAVDAAFYRAVYPELNLPELDAVTHYRLYGWREGRDPAPWFSVRGYLDANPDVAHEGVEPLHHFLTRGRREGREATPSPLGEAYRLRGLADGDLQAWGFAPLEPGVAPVTYVPPVEALPDRGDWELLAPEFDAAYYLALNPDIASSGMDPIEHFLIHGAAEGRDPHPGFSVRDYLEAYPDIAAAGINPFVHYVRTGRAEGRLPRHQLGFRYDLVSEAAPVEPRVRHAAWKSREATVDAAAVLAEALAESRSSLRDLHITFSHDDYSANVGGVQLCLQREDARIAELGRDHLHLYPVVAWPVVRTAAEPGPLGVLWNGRRVGVFRGRDVAKVLRKAAGAVQPGARSFAVHSLLGHAADETIDIVQAAGLEAGYFWLHDFASLCAGFHLLRNDVEDCGAPPPDSTACGICLYGPMRGRHLDEHGRLFDRLDLTVVSPSAPTLELWRQRWSFPTAGEIVHPHATLFPRGPAPKARRGPFRLAFAGLPVAHKGWPIFQELALKYADDPRYAFLHLGSRTPPGAAVEFHPVSVTAANPWAMQDALEAAQADAVLIWSLVRETFSFTAYEAAASGAAVVTGPDSGNVAAFVQATGHGVVLPDEAALVAALESGEILKLGRKRRDAQLYGLEFSALTVDLLTAKAAAA